MRALAAETLSHELTHFIEDFAKEEYSFLLVSVVEVLFNKNSEKFAEYSAVDSSKTDPAYTREILDKYCAPGVAYDDFAAFVGQYSFDEITALKK